MSNHAKYVAVDCETRDLSARYDPECPLWMTGFGVVGEDRVFITEDLDSTKKMVQHYLDNDYTLVFVNASFDVAVLIVRGIMIPEDRYIDLAVMHYCLFPDSMEHHSLNNMSQLYLGRTKLESPDFTTPNDIMRKYLTVDIECTRDLTPVILEELAADGSAEDFYYEIEHPYITTVIEMQTNGVAVDVEKFHEARIEWQKYVNEVTARFQGLAGYKRGKVVQGSLALPLGCNRKMTTKISDGVYSHCELEWARPTAAADIIRAMKKQDPDIEWLKISPKSGQPVLDKYTLPVYAADFELCKVLLEHRTAFKFVSAFLAPISEKVSEQNNIVRCDFRQTNVRTGRLSSALPNLQQIPSDKERGAIIRRMFIAEPGESVIVGDLDRIEVVVFAFYLREMFGYTRLADAVISGIDVHQANADAWGIARKSAKVGIFLLIYGGGPEKLAVSCDIPSNEARKVFKRINRDLPIEEYQEILFKEARSNSGFLYNYFGRRLYVPEVLSQSNRMKSSGRRKCGNYMIQSSAGDAFKSKQTEARSDIVYEHLGLKQRLAVHDEAYYTAPHEFAQEAADYLTEVYTDLEIFDGIPMRAKFNVASNWHEAKGE